MSTACTQRTDADADRQVCDAGEACGSYLTAGLDTASSGEVMLDGEPLHKLDEEARAALRAAKVGFVFQSFMLVQSLTALENVMLPAELAGEHFRDKSSSKE